MTEKFKEILVILCLSQWFSTMLRKKIVVWIYYATVDTNVNKSDLPRTSCKVSFRFVPSKILLFLYFPFSFPWVYTIFCSRKSKCSSNIKHSKSIIAFGKTPNELKTVARRSLSSSCTQIADYEERYWPKDKQENYLLPLEEKNYLQLATSREFKEKTVDLVQWPNMVQLL